MLNEVHPNNPCYTDWHSPQFDEQDADELASRVALWDKRTGPRVGDFIVMPDGSEHRFCHDWHDGLQTTPGGSFYFGNGYADYSGGLDPTLKNKLIIATPKQKAGQFWFFHHNSARAHNGVYFKVLCRVFYHKHYWRNERAAALVRGEYQMSVPGPTTGNWDTIAWCNHVQFYDKCLAGFDDRK